VLNLNISTEKLHAVPRTFWNICICIAQQVKAKNAKEPKFFSRTPLREPISDKV